MSAAGNIGNHRALIPPGRHCPEVMPLVAPDGTGKESVDHADLRDRPVCVEREERHKAQRAGESGFR